VALHVIPSPARETLGESWEPSGGCGYAGRDTTLGASDHALIVLHLQDELSLLSSILSYAGDRLTHVRADARIPANLSRGTGHPDLAL
jgi:hypothetical protein